MRLQNKWVVFAATGGYTGFARFAPGTFGTLPAVVVWFALFRFGAEIVAVTTVAVIIAAMFIADAAERCLEAKDPGSIVIDEIAGYLVTVLGLPFHPLTALAGFVVFRAFDITKPYPIRILEKDLEGGTAVVMDDILAGIYGNLVLRFLFFAGGMA